MSEPTVQGRLFDAVSWGTLLGMVIGSPVRRRLPPQGAALYGGCSPWAAAVLAGHGALSIEE